MLDILGQKFGVTKNTKGYKMLPPYVRIIQGDGISYESLSRILECMKEHGWSSDNIAFGSGGALLQRIDRDTQKCAYKCSYTVINGKEVCKVHTCLINVKIKQMCIYIYLKKKKKKW